MPYHQEEDESSDEDYEKNLNETPLSEILQNQLRGSFRLADVSICSPEDESDSPRNIPFVIENKVTGGKYRIYPHTAFKMNSTEYSERGNACPRYLYEAEDISERNESTSSSPSSISVCVIAQYTDDMSELENYKLQVLC